MTKGVQHATDSESIELQIAYIHGRFDQQLEGFALAIGLPSVYLAERISTLLRPSGPGAQNYLPSVPREAKTRNTPARKVEVVDGSLRDKTQVKGSRGPYKPRKRKEVAKAVSAYWAKMTPQQRSAEMARRRQVTLARKRKEAA